MKKGNCEKSRTVFELFKMFSCDNCCFYNDDYYFYLGRSIIAVYYINYVCKKVEEEYLFVANEKIEMIVNEAIKCQDSSILIIDDQFDVKSYYDVIEGISELDYDIQVMTIC